ncbi:MAG: hypothetical protein OXT09_14535 [Myxococcales bacterium]|nr:hypothetical protein [Myxococcales bacterium]
MSLARTWFPALLAALLLACTDTGGEGATAKREFEQFQREVYPVLLRDCGFPACHGDPERFFRVFGPGRVRLPGETVSPAALDQPTGNELSVSYALAQSMIDLEDPGDSPLLRKPLAVEAGGAGHFGVDQYDRDVYRTEQDMGYLLIARWVYNEPEEDE